MRTVVLQCGDCFATYTVELWPGAPETVEGLPRCRECSGRVEDGICDHPSGVPRLGADGL